VIRVELPKVLCTYAGANGDNSIELSEPVVTVGDALEALRIKAPGVLDRVMDETGAIRPHVNVFVNDESIRWLEGLDTRVADASTITILAAVSGG
jgi:molybdopterin converting factor small subunit